jgi:hypothetical protein
MAESVKGVSLAPYSAPKFILVDRERGKVLRAGGLPGLLRALGVA